jgi:hypothetical protein
MFYHISSYCHRYFLGWSARGDETPLLYIADRLEIDDKRQIQFIYLYKATVYESESVCVGPSTMPWIHKGTPGSSA